MEVHCSRLDCVDEGSRGTPNGIAIEGFDPWLDPEGPIVGVSAKPITESGKIGANRPSGNGLQAPPACGGPHWICAIPGAQPVSALRVQFCTRQNCVADEYVWIKTPLRAGYQPESRAT